MSYYYCHLLYIYTYCTSSNLYTPMSRSLSNPSFTQQSILVNSHSCLINPLPAKFFDNTTIENQKFASNHKYSYFSINFLLPSKRKNQNIHNVSPMGERRVYTLQVKLAKAAICWSKTEFSLSKTRERERVDRERGMQREREGEGEREDGRGRYT